MKQQEHIFNMFVQMLLFFTNMFSATPVNIIGVMYNTDTNYTTRVTETLC
jgi:hypothetical protein